MYLLIDIVAKKNHTSSSSESALAYKQCDLYIYSFYKERALLICLFVLHTLLIQKEMIFLNCRRFSSCVNKSTWSEYNMSARLYKLDYCESGAAAADEPVTGNERAFGALFAALLALAAVSTVLDLTIPDHSRKS